MSAAVQHFLSSICDDGDLGSVRRRDEHSVRDTAWIDEIQNGKEDAARAAFEALYHAYATSLGRFAKSYLEDEDTANQLVADVFIGIWNRRAEWAPVHGAAVYLYGALRNRALNAARANQRRARLVEAVGQQDVMAGLSAPAIAADEAVDRNEIATLVWQAIDALGEPKRQAVILRWHHGMTAAQIAEVLGLTPGAVYQLLNRAHALLKQLLAPALD